MAPDHARHDHHHATLPRFSLLRAGAPTRLGIAAGGLAVLWAAIAWALNWV